MRNKLLSRAYKKIIESGATALLVAAATGIFLLPEAKLVNLMFKLRGPVAADSALVVVALDEAFARNHDFPEVVPRDYLAELLRASKAARTVAVCYEFNKFDERTASFGEVVSEIANLGHVVLINTLDTSGGAILETLPAELQALAAAGYQDVPAGAPQRFSAYRKLGPQTHAPSFALATVANYLMPDSWLKRKVQLHANREPLGVMPSGQFWSQSELDSVLAKTAFPDVEGDATVLLNYAGPLSSGSPCYIPSDDFLKLVDQEPDWVAGKLLLIGPTYRDVKHEEQNTAIETPFGLMPGVILQANIISNLLSRAYLTEPSAVVKFLLSLGAFTLAGLIVWRFRLLPATAATVGILAVYLAVVYILFSHFQLLLPTEYPLKAAILGFFFAFFVQKQILTRKTQRDWLDFHLLLEEGMGEHAYRLRVIAAPQQAGDAKADIQIEPDGALAQSLRQLQQGRIRPAEVETLGSRLYEMLMPPDIEKCYLRSLTQARIEKKGLRLRLRLDAPALQVLPWEYLYDRSSNTFLAASSEVLLSRYVESEQPRRALAAKELHVLIVISNPASESAEQHQLGDLNASQELDLMVDALTELDDVTEIPIRHTVLDHAIPARIQEKLSAGVDILHFIGHSTYQDGQGKIVLENDKYEVRLTGAREFAELLAGRTDLRLVVLNSCESAQTSALPEVSGLAYQIISRGVPAVAAMQQAIADDTAVVFAREFYRNLASFYPVDFAMAQARIAIRHEFGAKWPADFGIPVLFMRSDDGRIIAEKA